MSSPKQAAGPNRSPLDAHRQTKGPRKRAARELLYRTAMCPQQKLKGWCSTGDECAYAHDESQLRELPRGPDGRELCRFFLLGRCGYAAHCAFSHAYSLDQAAALQDQAALGTTPLHRQTMLRLPPRVEQAERGAERETDPFARAVHLGHYPREGGEAAGAIGGEPPAQGLASGPASPGGLFSSEADSSLLVHSPTWLASAAGIQPAAAGASRSVQLAARLAELRQQAAGGSPPDASPLHSTHSSPAEQEAAEPAAAGPWIGVQ